MNQPFAPTGNAPARPKTIARAEYPPADYWTRWPEPPPRSAPALQAGESAKPETPPHTDPALQTSSPAVDATAPTSAPAATEDAEAPYNVLIVEDDRSQGLFAQTILRGAGIQSHVVGEATEVMAALRQLKPDLVLMDLHLERLTGTDLTGMIRREGGFEHMPIVFLTGDPDPERQFEVLELGADDYLSKPVRPRLLISAVQNRIKRARALRESRVDTAVADPRTGLHQRQHVIDCINQAVQSGSGGGVQLVEVLDAQAVHRDQGYAALEERMAMAGRLLARNSGEHPVTRLNDDSFLVFVADANASQLEALSQRLQTDIAQQSVELSGDHAALQVAIGHVMLTQGQATAGHVIDAAGQALHAARQAPSRTASVQGDVQVSSSAEQASGLEQLLGDARLELVFQPVVAVAGSDEAQFQVLVRARTPDGAIRPARDLLPAAEQSGVMPAVDRWVMTQVVAYLSHHAQRTARLFVTQSPRTLADDGYADWLIRLLDAHGVDRSLLVIDLRAQDMQAHSATLRRFSERMVGAGLPLCLSGYRKSPEMASMLSQLALAFIRLSPDYSRGAVHARDEIRTLIDAVHRQGIKVIAQQLEDPQDAALLWISGIDYIQGNLVQEPQAALDFDFGHAVL